MSELSGPLVVPPEGAAEAAFGAEHEIAPEAAITPPGRWMKENLFSSWSNGIQTFVFAAILIGILKWVLNLVFAEESDWASVATNIRLLFAYNYPVEQFVRIWVSLGTLFAAASLSIAAWHLDMSISLRKLGLNVATTGGVFLLIGILVPGSAPTDVRTGIFVTGAILLLIGLAVLFGVKDPHRKRVPFEALLIGTATIVVALVWLFPLGRYEFTGNTASYASGTVNISTKGPWTVMMIVLVASFFIGKGLLRLIPDRALKGAMAVFWIAGPAFLIFVVLRDPAFDWSYIWKVDVPMTLGFVVLGGGLLYFLTKPGLGEIGRVIGAVLFGFAVFNYVAAFFGLYPMLQKARISFLLLAVFAILAPTFSGERAARLRFAAGWAGLIVLTHWLITAINTPSTLDIAAPPFLGGFVLSLTIAYYVLVAAFPLGILLALARTSKLPIFRVMATVYIEVVRGVPLITILFFFSIMLNLFLPGGMSISELAAIFTGYALFSAAYMAENVRGGLQAIRRGQYEASDALGLTTIQRTLFIVLPQALRVTIPNLVGQAIATFKETSLVAIVGGFELVRIANQTIPNQPDYIGQNRPALLFISVVYWVFCYSMSRASRSLERRLGVGTGR
jgi:general L-amino acid transport system permease protein